MQLRKVSDQPLAVTRSVDEFVKVLTEAVVIVLLVSFLSLGLRTGRWSRCRSRWCWR